ncbi:MAG: DUF1801 domain-containing protein [Chitinophagaceae bacterium]|nr:DUF1801 domain-containing protein [Chitinophagaceae bacterium]
MSMKFKTVDEYMAASPVEVREKIEGLRKLIKKAAPKAEEVISYNMPAYKLHGILVYFAGYKTHIGFYPTPSGVEAFKKELANYDVSKGTVRFDVSKPLPTRLITDIVKFRVAENLDRAAQKGKKP